MELIGKIAMDNCTIFEGVKIQSTPVDYVPSVVNTIKNNQNLKLWTIQANGLDISKGQITKQKQ